MDQDALTKLIERVRSDPRNTVDWESLYRLLWPFLLARMYRKLRANHYLAEEASQEVMLRIIRYFDFENSTTNVPKFMNYLARTCSSVLSDFERRKDPGPFYSEDWLWEHHTEDSADEWQPDPEQETILRDVLQRVSTELKPRERKIMLLLLEGRTSEEISTVEGLDLKTARNLISGVRRNLRKALFSDKSDD